MHIKIGISLKKSLMISLMIIILISFKNILMTITTLMPIHHQLLQDAIIIPMIMFHQVNIVILKLIKNLTRLVTDLIPKKRKLKNSILILLKIISLIIQKIVILEMPLSPDLIHYKLIIKQKLRINLMV